ncbi:MAG TPA: hypothetical protein VH414_22200 [Lichenihabitans sp.]|nr:hypothetical protein [Lichenihabitans sp.]
MRHDDDTGRAKGCEKAKILPPKTVASREQNGPGPGMLASSIHPLPWRHFSEDLETCTFGLGGLIGHHSIGAGRQSRAGHGGHRGADRHWAVRMIEPEQQRIVDSGAARLAGTKRVAVLDDAIGRRNGVRRRNARGEHASVGADEIDLPSRQNPRICIDPARCLVDGDSIGETPQADVCRPSQAIAAIFTRHRHPSRPRRICAHLIAAGP